MSEYATALASENARLRSVLKQIETTPGNDVERLKRIAREALEEAPPVQREKL